MLQCKHDDSHSSYFFPLKIPCFSFNFLGKKSRGKWRDMDSSLSILCVNMSMGELMMCSSFVKMGSTKFWLIKWVLEIHLCQPMGGRFVLGSFGKYEQLSVEFWAWLVKILVFPRPTNYMLTSFGYIYKIEIYSVNSFKRSVIFLKSWI